MTGATDDVAVDHQVAAVDINQDVARAVGAHRCAVHACTCGVGRAVVQGHAATSHQDDVAVGARQQVALRSIGHGAGRSHSAEVAHAHRHRVDRHCVVFCHEDARCVGARRFGRERRHVGREVVERCANGVVCFKAQVRRRDVLAAERRVDDGARVCKDAHVGRAHVAQRDVGARSQAQGRTRGDDIAGSQHDDGAAGGQQMDGTRRRRADVGRCGVQTDVDFIGCMNGDVAGAAGDLGLDDHVGASTLGIKQHVPAAIGNHCADGGVCHEPRVQRDAAALGNQHDVPVVACHQIRLAVGLRCKCCGAIDALHRHTNGVNRNSIGLSDVNTAGTCASGQGDHAGFDVVAAGSDGTAGGASAHEPTGCDDVHLGFACCGVAIQNAATGHQAHVATGAAGGDGFQGDGAAASLQADVAAGAGDRARRCDAVGVVLRQGNVMPCQVVNGFAAGLAADIGVLQDVLRGIQAKVAVGQDEVGIKLDVSTGACGFEQDVAVGYLDAKGGAGCVSITLAHQDGACGGLQDQVTDDHQVGLCQIGGGCQCGGIGAHTLHRQGDGLANFDSGGFV